MNIEQLLEQYFEGLTSSDEEAILRRYFTSDDVPESLMMYKPLFVFFENEIRKAETDSYETCTVSPDEAGRRLNSYETFAGAHDETVQPTTGRRTNRRKTIAWWLSGAAACAAILAGSFFITSPQKRCTGTGDYVIINGRCYTDATTIRSTLLETLHEVSKTEDLFSSDQPEDGFDNVKNQLEKFNFLLDEKIKEKIINARSLATCMPLAVGGVYHAG
jgi:hypothetical protein